jgi:hypothetical protein
MPQFIVLEHSFSKLVKQMVQEEFWPIYLSEQNDKKTLVVDFSRTNFLSIDQTAAALYQQAIANSVVTSHYTQGNFSASELPELLFTELNRSLVKRGKENLVQVISNNHYNKYWNS